MDSFPKIRTIILLHLSITYLSKDYVYSQQAPPKRYVLNTEGCSIPDFEGFDPELAKYFIYNGEEAKCNNGYPPLVDSNSAAIFIVDQSKRFYGILEDELLYCHYTPFYRTEPTPTSKDKQWNYGKSRNFSEFAVIENEEFIVVDCFYKTMHIYKDFFSFVPFKNHTFNDNSFNVLLIGLDGISRLNFYRQMLKTRRVLNEMNTVELFGYNKIGDNSYPNLLAMFTGLSEDEIINLCWPDTKHYFDECPFIWKTFKEKGYTTVFAEDCSWLGTFHYSTKKGFKTQTTDYFWSYFNYVAEHLSGNRANANVWDCIGARETYKVFLEYIKRFVHTMHEHNIKYFGYFFETVMSHDNINKPRLSDETIANFFDGFLKKVIIKNTILIFFSDHGSRYGKFRKTYQGAIEGKLPFIYFYLPTSFKTKFSTAYENLLTNRRRLTTPYDLHETLLDLIDPDTNINSRVSSRRRFYSLFDVIPENRTCEDASIPINFCSCYNSTETPTNNTVVKKVSLFVLDYINKMFKNTDCKRLTLEAILSARYQNVPRTMANATFFDVIVIIQTLPGAAQFEATVRVNQVEEEKYLNEIMGSVSRVNAYGNQSACEQDFRLKPYCYCA